MIFGDLPEYDGFFKVLVLFFQSALGQWDFEIYENSRLGALFGQYYHLVFILLNMVMLVNFFIAILTETYYRLAVQKLGLYYDGIIEVIPAYKYKKFYGALIAACPPFNLIVLPFLPIFAMNKRKSKVRRLNNTLVKVIFFPFALIYAAIFGFCNILMMPFAYILNCYRKLKFIFHVSQESEKKENTIQLFIWLFGGMFMLIGSQFVDIYYFISHLYNFTKENITQDFLPVIS